MPLGGLGSLEEATPVLGVSDGIDDGIVDGRSLGDDSWHGAHVGRQVVRIPRTEKVWGSPFYTPSCLYGRPCQGPN